MLKLSQDLLKMQLSHALNDGLVGLLVTLEVEGGILL